MFEWEGNDNFQTFSTRFKNNLEVRVQAVTLHTSMKKRMLSEAFPYLLRSRNFKDRPIYSSDNAFVSIVYHKDDDSTLNIDPFRFHPVGMAVSSEYPDESAGDKVLYSPEDVARIFMNVAMASCEFIQKVCQEQEDADFHERCLHMDDYEE